MSRNESERHSREFMLKAVEWLEAGERASALAIELNVSQRRQQAQGECE